MIISLFLWLLLLIYVSLISDHHNIIWVDISNLAMYNDSYISSMFSFGYILARSYISSMFSFISLQLTLIRRCFRNQLFSILVKIVSSPKEWPTFAIYLEEFRCSKIFFSIFKIQYISRAHNLMADKLICSARCSSFVMFYVDFMPPTWFSEPVEHIS